MSIGISEEHVELASSLRKWAADLTGRGAEVDRGLAAVGADLERRAVGELLPRVAVQQVALVLGHEALRVEGVLEEVRGHVGHGATLVEL